MEIKACLVFCKNFYLKHFLILTEIIAVAIAFIVPIVGQYLAHSTVSLCIVAVIFLFSGLKLKTDEIKNAWKSLDVIITGLVSSLFITGFAAGGAINALPFRGEVNSTNGSAASDGFDFGPQELKLGLILFNCLPCTIATGIVMVTDAEGDVIASVTISTIANLAGCFTSPLIFSLFVGGGVLGQNSVDLVKKLGLSLILPLFVGKIISLLFEPVRTKVARFKKEIGLLQNTGICIILWIKLSKSIYNDTFNLLKWEDLAVLLALCIVVHLLQVLINFVLSVVTCLKREQVCVMLLLVSQKTLVLGTAIASALPSSLGDSTLILLPAFIAHPLQMLLDSFLVAPLRRSTVFPLVSRPVCRGSEPSPAVELEAPKPAEGTVIEPDCVVISNQNLGDEVLPPASPGLPEHE